ncbi:MAG: hypothetical protein E7167_03800 [Firmicutes bacterium]|nr:hypothetical protein [Bacillota bacterium]
MKKKQIDEILVNQAKRKSKLFLLICYIAINSIMCILFFMLFVKGNKNYYVKYYESNNTDYVVNLKENEFFEKDFLTENNEYISTLIDNIVTNFKYNLQLEEENVSYKYSYKIESKVNVKRKNGGHNLYNKKETLLNTVEKITNQNTISINEKITIDYNYYNNLMKKFVSIYSLEDIESTLNIKMHIKIIGSCEKFEESNRKESTISINIPLTTKVLNIEIMDDLINNQNNLIQCKKMYDNAYMFLIISILFAALGLSFIVYTINFILKTRTAENIYEKELKKILNNYGSYIQTINNDFNFKTYQMLIIHSFNDMLEIRDTIGQPILMKENEEKDSAYFIIPGATKILYIYRLKVTDIKKELTKNLEK